MAAEIPRRKKYTLKKNYYIALLLFLLTPLFKVFLHLKVRKKKSIKEEWRKGLILGPSHIGDLLYFTSSLKILSKNLPNCKWYCVAETYSSQILENNPFISGIIKINSLSELLFKKKRAYKEIKKIDADVVLIMMKNNYLPFLFLSVKLGIPNRIGFGDKGLEYFLTQIITTPEIQLTHAAYYRHIVEELLCNKYDSDLKPEIYITEKDMLNSDKYLKLSFKNINLPIIVIYATTKTSGTNWSLEYYSEFICLLLKKFNVNILLVGAKSDLNTLSYIASKKEENVVIAAGTLSLFELACIIKKAIFIFGPDSGPRHIANSVSTPAYFIPNLADSIENDIYCDTEVNLIPNKNFLTTEESNRLLNELTPSFIINLILKSDKIDRNNLI